MLWILVVNGPIKIIYRYVYYIILFGINYYLNLIPVVFNDLELLKGHQFDRVKVSRLKEIIEYRMYQIFKTSFDNAPLPTLLETVIDPGV